VLLTEAARPYEKTQNEEMAGKRERGRESERGRETKLAARFPQNPLFLEALTSGDKYSRVDTHIPVDSLMRSEVSPGAPDQRILKCLRDNIPEGHQIPCASHPR